MFKKVARDIAGATCAMAVMVAGTASAQQSPAPDFIPDYIFEDGQDIESGHVIGEADWNASGERIVGNARSGPGLFMFEKSYQNIAFYSRFRCAGECDAGIIIRAKETPDGMEAILVAIEDGTLNPYRVTLDETGQIISRKSARSDNAQPRDGDYASDIIARATEAFTAPVQIKPGEWNEIEIFVDGNSIYNHLNNQRNAIRGGTAQDLPEPPPAGLDGAVPPVVTNNYLFGPTALYVGSGTVEFDAIAMKDLLEIQHEPEKTSSRFRVQQLTPFAYSWGADIADINRDGVPDVISGAFYYLGPDYTFQRELYEARTYNPGLEYYNDMQTFANDWNGDGWPDVLATERRPVMMYVNPGQERRYWDKVNVLPEACSEYIARGDIDADESPEIIYTGADGRVAYAEADPDNLNGPFLVHKISEPIYEGCNTHAGGVGDVNGDGLVDILSARGWWEQPVSGPDQGMWIYHDDWFGRLTRSPQHPGGAEISVYDFNGDGLNDVVTSLSAHGWGLAWYEQQRDSDNNISFVEHMIMGDYSTANAGDVTFSQVHSGATLADIDGDGVMDFVTGKRHFSHLANYTDPDPFGEAVIYWYRTVRNPLAPGGVEFVPELIHNKSGVGSEVKVGDLDNDGRVDIVTAGSHGAFIYWNKGGQGPDAVD